jgi:hypothetical protein
MIGLFSRCIRVFDAIQNNEIARQGGQGIAGR